MRYETMQESVESAQARVKDSKDQSTEAPIGGWNTRDLVDNVPPSDALLLDNWTCGLGSVSIRKGYIGHSYSYGLDGHTSTPVKTLMKYATGGDTQMIAADGDALWVATTPGGITEVFPYTGGDVWSWANFRGGAAGSGGYLVAVNGTSSVSYDGSTFSTLEFFDEDSAPLDITPIGCFAFKNRMYYWEANSQTFYYTELYARAGIVHEYPVGTIGQFGGHIVSIETVTHDGGHGTDDYLLIFMSSGDCIAYQGSYPADEADWGLVGMYNPGLPMGPRSFAKFGGDLYMMTDLDILPMSKILKGIEATDDLTKISGAMEKIAAFRGNFGFQVEVYPPAKLMIFNVTNGPEFQQFVMNTVTKAWSRWLGVHAYCWLEYDGDLYFGGDDGVVYQAESGNHDSALLKSDSPVDTFQAPYAYSNGGGANPGTAATGTQSVPWDPTVNGRFEVNTIGFDGVDYTAGLSAIAVGDDISLENTDVTETYTGTITEIQLRTPNLPATPYFYFYVEGRDPDTIPGWDLGANCIFRVVTAVPPTPGADQNFKIVPIKSAVQTAHLRFGVEENKQWDAVKIFFKSQARVSKSLGFAVDYQDVVDFDYPPLSSATGTPWSAEIDPPPPEDPAAWVPPATIPDPTTWWSDEGNNPATPVNDETRESGVGAKTPWTAESKTTERWDTIAGVGRAITMLMKLTTTTQVDWNLTLWHLKLASRM